MASSRYRSEPLVGIASQATKIWPLDRRESHHFFVDIDPPKITSSGHRSSTQHQTSCLLLLWQPSVEDQVRSSLLRSLNPSLLSLSVSNLVKLSLSHSLLVSVENIKEEGRRVKKDKEAERRKEERKVRDLFSKTPSFSLILSFFVLMRIKKRRRKESVVKEKHRGRKREEGLCDKREEGLPLYRNVEW
jgi:hypothetical protein